MSLALMRIVFLCTIGAVFFSGCGRSARARKKSQEKHVATQLQIQEDLVYELEAKLHDIPIPFHPQCGILLSEYSKANDSVILKYNLATSCSDLTSFYDKEMEILGWRQVAFMQGIISLLVFEKPGRLIAFQIKTKRAVDGCETQELIVFNSRKTEYRDSIK